MGPDRDRTRDPWICSQTRSQTSVARHVTDCATRPGPPLLNADRRRIRAGYSPNSFLEAKVDA